MSDINNTLATRQATHGCFGTNATVSQGLKEVLYHQPNYEFLTPVEREALDVICTKLGRIMSGDPHFDDHWADIAGYSELVRKDNREHPPVQVDQSLDYDPNDIPF